MLTAASERHGTVIYLLADEPYARLVFDDRTHISPAESYPHTLIAYSYGKTLVAPGERLGWLALGPDMPEADRAALREAVDMAQVSHGWAFAGRTLQRALPDLEGLCIDVAALQRRRDRMVEGLRAAGLTCRSRRAPSSSSHAPRCRTMPPSRRGGGDIISFRCQRSFRSLCPDRDRERLC
ncbi:MAG: aminotransferase class I/II-fold pyridoxal phosphate-dependent enzyme [Rhodoplanes sp.]